MESETSNVQLPADLQQLLNSFTKRSTEPAPGINLQLDPIVDALKKVDEQVDLTKPETPSVATYSPSDPVEDESESDSDVVAVERKEDLVPESLAPENVDECKTRRDPRIKATSDGLQSTQSTATQPPPPGMEDEFASTPTTNAPTPITDAALTASLVTDAAYAVSMAGAHFGFPAAAGVPPFPPGLIPPQMYMPSVYPQSTALPYGAIPPPPMYVPPQVIHRDPSVMPMSTDAGDKLSQLKRKAPDELDMEGERDKDERLPRMSDSRSRKPYYGDAKSRRSDSRSPPR